MMSPNTIPAAVSWSGGKDACLATWRAKRQGYEIRHLLNLVTRETGRCCFHGVPSQLVALQAERMGLPLLRREVSKEMMEYEVEFKSALESFPGIRAVVFGDIYLDHHKEWVERVCREAGGLTALEPIWNEDPVKLVEEFLDAGFKAVIVTCQAQKLGREFCGREMSRDLIWEMVKLGVCPCGENGEFHTLVVDGPLFSRPIRIMEAEPVLRKGFWDHWALDIRKFE